MDFYLNYDKSSHTKKDEINWKWNLQVFCSLWTDNWTNKHLLCALQKCCEEKQLDPSTI